LTDCSYKTKKKQLIENLIFRL